MTAIANTSSSPGSLGKVHQATVFLLCVAIIGIGAFRIIATYHVFSLTWDERFHIGAGMEWLADGRFTYEPQHPPLARVFTALGPFLDGNAPEGPKVTATDLWKEQQPNLWMAFLHGDEVIFEHGDPARNIWLARLGILPFFLVTSCLVYLWTASIFGTLPGLLALALFTSMPPVLAHSGLATTDMAPAATIFLTMFVFIEWLQHPSRLWSAALGVSTALAFLSKFSSFVFLPACVAGVLVWYSVIEMRRSGRIFSGQSNSATLFNQLSGIAIALGFLTVTVWAGYRFSIGPILAPGANGFTTIDRVLEPGTLSYRIAYALVQMPLPAHEFFRGVEAVVGHANLGHPSYLLGEVRRFGWWYYFPVAFAFKTPIPFIALATIGGALMVRQSWQEKRWSIAAPLVCAITIMLVVLPSPINIGLRHILPIYGFASVVAGYGAVRVYRIIRNRAAGWAVVGALTGWQIFSSINVHPDYLAYFNELAQLTRDPVLVDTDLDWGQDILRLVEDVRARHIERISVALNGFQNCPPLGLRDAAHYALPEIEPLIPYQAKPGWIAISYVPLYLERGYSWLRRYEPEAAIGRSILLYHLSEHDFDQVRRSEPVEQNDTDLHCG